MKKLFFLIMLLFSLSAVAKETIKIYWGFNIGSNQAKTLRILVEKINQKQDKYNFIIEQKTGAGGSIAALSVLQDEQSSLVAMSSSFIIRPLYEKTGTHNLENFQVIFSQAEGSPIGLVSNRNNSFESIKNKERITIGIAGYGTISHLVALAFSKNVDTTVDIIPYRSMVDALFAVAKNEIDLAPTFIIDAEPLLSTNQIKVLGYTGQNEFKSINSSLLENKIFTGLTANYAIFGSRNLDKNKQLEIYNLFKSVNSDQEVIESYNKDYLLPLNLTQQETIKWFETQKQYWKSIINFVR
jgi:tripartite-type tricarboxylate transporter receptor subunit TctC